MLAQRLGRDVVRLGAVVMAAGCALLAWTVSGADHATSWWAFVPGVTVVGAGFGLMVASVGLFSLADVPVEDPGIASGLYNTTGQLANAVGIAAIGTVFFTVVERTAPAAPDHLFGPAFEAVLALTVVLLAGAFVAARRLPAAAADPSGVPTH